MGAYPFNLRSQWNLPRGDGTQYDHQGPEKACLVKQYMSQGLSFRRGKRIGFQKSGTKWGKTWRANVFPVLISSSASLPLELGRKIWYLQKYFCSNPPPMDQAEERKKKAQISKQRPSLNGCPFTGNTETSKVPRMTSVTNKKALEWEITQNFPDY